MIDAFPKLSNLRFAFFGNDSIDKIIKILYYEETMKKTAILVFSAFFLIFSFLSLEFVLTHTNHSHEDTWHENSCHVCIIIHSVNNLLKNIFSTVKAFLPIMIAMLGGNLLLKNNTLSFKQYTLVNLKVRIDN